MIDINDFQQKQIDYLKTQAPDIIFIEGEEFNNAVLVDTVFVDSEQFSTACLNKYFIETTYLYQIEQGNNYIKEVAIDRIKTVIDQFNCRTTFSNGAFGCDYNVTNYSVSAANEVINDQDKKYYYGFSVLFEIIGE